MRGSRFYGVAIFGNYPNRASAERQGITASPLFASVTFGLSRPGNSKEPELLIDRRAAGRARCALMRSITTLRLGTRSRDIPHRQIFVLIAKFVPVLILYLASSCGGSLYRVKSVSELPPLSDSAPTSNLGSVSLRAQPLLTDEESQELFESNLNLAGLLPVRVAFFHNSGDAIELKKTRFHLRDATGVEWKSISAKQAIARILKANQVFAYNPNSRKIFEKEFRAYELDLKSPLTHSERRREGLVIFLSPGKVPVASPRGLVLAVEGLPQPVTLNLN